MGRLLSLFLTRQWLRRALVLAVALLAILLLWDRPQEQPQPPSPGCPATLQSLVDTALPSSTVEIPTCIYRETVTLTKPITLIAQQGAEIRGSDIWANGWTKRGRHWVHGGVPKFAAHGECVEGSRRCLWPEQVFFDQRQLEQVTSNPQPGQFAVSRGRLFLADDPSGHVVEVSVRQRWVVGESDNITIRGFTMKHAANDAQTGAIQSIDHSHWTIEGNTLSEAHGYIIYFEGGTNHRIIGNDISRAGQLGIGLARNEDVLVQANRIHHNHTEDFNCLWECGGLKAAGVVTRLTMDRNEVYNNGQGLWCDGDCRDIVFSNNRVYDNSGDGLFFEISAGAKIFGNVVWNNGWGGNNGAGIVAASSRDVEVYENILAWNYFGIMVYSEDREEFNKNNGFNNYIHDNTIVMESRGESYALAWGQAWNGNLFSPAANNRGERNKYGYATPTESPNSPRFSWDGRNYDRLADFNATPGEESGRYLSTAEQEAALKAVGVPLAPPRRP